MRCIHCTKEINIQKIGFKETCENCDGYLHCCLNCKFYKVGQPNNCMIPNTEVVKDRSHFNYCEEFSPIDVESPPSFKQLDEIEKKLFGFSDSKKPIDPFERFNSIFKDS